MARCPVGQNLRGAFPGLGGALDGHGEPIAVGVHLPCGVQPLPRSLLQRRHEHTADPRTELHGPMAPIGDHGRPRSDGHSNGGADLESRTD